jgi:hypothetical protein
MRTYLLVGLSEELTLGLLTALLSFLWLNESSVGDLVDLDGRNIELGGSLDDISSVDSSEWNTVDLVWT